MERLLEVTDAWIESARAKLRRGELGEADPELLRGVVRACAARRRQRLLYLIAFRDAAP